MELGEASFQGGEGSARHFLLDLLLGQKNISKLHHQWLFTLNGSEHFLGGGDVASGEGQGDVIEIGFVGARGGHFLDGFLHAGKRLPSLGGVKPERREIETIRQVRTHGQAASAGKQRLLRRAAAEQLQAAQIWLDGGFALAVREASPHGCLTNEVGRLALPAGVARIDLLRRLQQPFIVPNLQPLPQAVQGGAQLLQVFIERRLERLADAATLNFVPRNQIPCARPLAIQASTVLIHRHDGLIGDELQIPQDDPVGPRATIG